MQVSNRDLERLLSRIKFGRLDECWEWQRAKVTNGYGCLVIQHKQRLAHRMIYAAAMGWDVNFDSKVLIRHLICDNPPCCNWTHLAPGTHADNSNDRWKKYIPKPKPIIVKSRKIKRTPEELDAFVAEAKQLGSWPFT